MKYYKFKVIPARLGSIRLPFPTDMLRYDKCYPADTDSSLDIVHSCNTDGINLISQHKPTKDRWFSFGWRITKISII